MTRFYANHRSTEASSILYSIRAKIFARVCSQSQIGEEISSFGRNNVGKSRNFPSLSFGILSEKLALRSVVSSGFSRIADPPRAIRLALDSLVCAAA